MQIEKFHIGVVLLVIVVGALLYMKVTDPVTGQSCTLDQRQIKHCIEIYQPVCGFFDPEKTQCLTYPCASDFSNSCFACQDETVKYWTPGECPSPE